MPLTPGSRLGHYRIEGQLGSGGMGEVYQARDSRLDRAVAIKVLLEHTSQQPEARDRFEREARTIARLNHPHICVLHDVGRHEQTDFLVMELLEGETLARRLERGQLPVNQALQYAIEIAGALDKAHRHGVTHRDLKPSNVMLTRSGVKLLDFGLAKPRSVDPPSMLSAATQAGATAQGVIYGTLQYMAPEQLEGREADPRSDIFALGAVLFEMVTGLRAFDGKSQAGVIGAILERHPAPPSTLQPAVPRALDGLIATCLAKDPDDRWQSAGDLALALKWIAGSLNAPGEVEQTDRRRFNRAARLPIAMAAALAVLAAVFGVLWFLGRQAEGELTMFPVFPPEGGRFESAFSPAVGQFIGGAISPNGRKIAFTSRDAAGKIQIWIRSLDALTAVPLAGTEGSGAGMFWSPDSEYLAFFSRGWLKKVKVSGSGVEQLCTAPNGRGGTWNGDEIVFAPNTQATPLYRVGAGGGECTPATTLEAGHLYHTYPMFLPGGRRFVYYAGGIAEPGVYLGSLDSLKGRRLLAADSSAVYAEPGYLLFVRQNILYAQRFDGTAIVQEEAPIFLAEPVPVSMSATPVFSVSDNGVMTYRTGPKNSSDVDLVWFDRHGNRLNSLGASAGFRGVELSRDETRIAIHQHEGSGGGSLIHERDKGMLPLTMGGLSQDNSAPLWSPIKDKEFVFGSLRNGKWGLYLSDGTRPEESIFEWEKPLVPMSWSPDGEFIVCAVTDPKTLGDIWMVPLDRNGKPAPLINSASHETHPQISPNGKWIAYVSNESGREEIHVQSFPSGEQRRPVTTTGGRFPRWSADSKELFYRDLLSGMNVVAVDGNGAEFRILSRDQLFTVNAIYPAHSFGDYHPYAVSRDGQRLLLSLPPGTVEGAPLSPITVVLNWRTLLPK
jgi:Tol biopolymer transport system component